MRKVLKIGLAVITGCSLMVGLGSSVSAHAISARRSVAPPTTVTVWSWRPQDAPMWKQVQQALDAKGDIIRMGFGAFGNWQYS